MTWVSSAKRQLESLHWPAARAAMIRARLVRLLEPGGVNSAEKGLWMGCDVTSLMSGILCRVRFAHHLCLPAASSCLPMQYKLLTVRTKICPREIAGEAKQSSS